MDIGVEEDLKTRLHLWDFRVVRVEIAFERWEDDIEELLREGYNFSMVDECLSEFQQLQDVTIVGRPRRAIDLIASGLARTRDRLGERFEVRHKIEYDWSDEDEGGESERDERGDNEGDEDVQTQLSNTPHEGRDITQQSAGRGGTRERLSVLGGLLER